MTDHERPHSEPGSGDQGEPRQRITAATLRAELLRLRKQDAHLLKALKRMRGEQAELVERIKSGEQAAQKAADDERRRARNEERRLRNELRETRAANARLRDLIQSAVSPGTAVQGAPEPDAPEEPRRPAPRRADDSGQPAARPVRLADRPIVIEVENVSKSFRVPDQRLPTLRKRILRHPLRRIGFHQHEVLRGVSFRIAKGEFFGVVGLNGVGKSTLLKLIAGGYQVDSGRIRVAGNLSALIELGVGFNPELSARDNVLYNGVLLGLTPKQARERYEAILEFADLEEFSELKFRNYSSGMRVRLGFSVMMQVDADVYLVDEALAVGDAEFQERCFELLAQRRREGKTIMLVSHSMAKVSEHCERALLLDNGGIRAIGPTELVARRYSELIRERQRRHEHDLEAPVPAPTEQDEAGWA